MYLSPSITNYVRFIFGLLFPEMIVSNKIVGAIGWPKIVAFICHCLRMKNDSFFKNTECFMSSRNDYLKMLSPRLGSTPPPRSSLMKSIPSAVEEERLTSMKQVAESSLSSSSRWTVTDT